MDKNTLVALLAGAMVLPSAFARDIYVDVNHVSAADTAADGRGDENLPYRTIQAAVDAAIAGTDTVCVKPGIYSEGENDPDSIGLKAVVSITKPVSVISTGGRAVTTILGHRDSGATKGFGANAARCVYVSAAATTGKLQGFTLRNGYTALEGNDAIWETDKGHGGGVRNKSDGFLVMDCAILDCCAGICGAGNGGYYVRCFVKNCTGTANTAGVAKSNIGGIEGGKMHSCVFVGSGTYSRNGTAVNCTFAGCSPQDTTTAYNGFVTANVAELVSPSLQDCRPLSSSGAIGAGDAANVLGVEGFTDSAIFGKDFNGVEYPKSGTINAGAVQEVLNAEALSSFSTINISGGDVIVDGCHSLKSGDFIRTENCVTQYLVNVSEKATTPCIAVSFGNSIPATTTRQIPDINGNVGLMPPTGGASYTAFLNYMAAGQEYYVDPDIEDDDGHDGKSKASAYKTINKAVSSITAGSGNVLIHLAAGDYHEEGGTSGGQKFAVYLPTKSGTRFFLKGAGVGQTVIHGRADPETKGCGENAVALVYSAFNNHTVQGVTFTDGYATTVGSGYGNKVMVCGQQNYNGFILSDCEIRATTGNSANFGNYVRFFRCRFVDNVCVGFNGNVVVGSCLFVNNQSHDYGILGYYQAMQNCTFKGRTDSRTTSWNGQGPSAGSQSLASCIVDTTKDFAPSKFTMNGVVLWNVIPSVSSVAGAIVAKPRFVVSGGDYPVREDSPAIGAGAVYEGVGYDLVSTGLDGARMTFANGRMVAGCYFQPVHVEKKGFMLLFR